MRSDQVSFTLWMHEQFKSLKDGRASAALNWRLSAGAGANVSPAEDASLAGAVGGTGYTLKGGAATTRA